MWNVPNLLTLLRIFLVPLLVVVLLTELPDKEYWGLGIFLLEALTDALDGIIARRTKTITTTGAMLDPVADKLLMSAAFISLVGHVRPSLSFVQNSDQAVPARGPGRPRCRGRRDRS